MKDNASSNLRLCRLERLTPYRGVRKNLTRTHPRLRGEHEYVGQVSQLCHGSSPLTRGTQSPCPLRRRFARFIPAYAGNTPDNRVSRLSGPVHPRLRGEHDSSSAAVMPVNGSSPLTRGTRTADAAACRYGRFIPAYAGNTRCAHQRRSGIPVHPRLRGEHKALETAASTRDGSSPLTRGTL